MSGTLIRKATDAVQQLLGQSRYRVDVHECSDFLDVLRFNAVESLSQPGVMTWRSPAPLRMLPATRYC